MDILLNFLPIDLVNEVLKFYDPICKICNHKQFYCFECELYLCKCDNIISCIKCNDFTCLCQPYIRCYNCQVSQCNKNCNPLIKICDCCDSFLCYECWNT